MAQACVRAASKLHRIVHTVAMAVNRCRRVYRLDGYERTTHRWRPLQRCLVWPGRHIVYNRRSLVWHQALRLVGEYLVPEDVSMLKISSNISFRSGLNKVITGGPSTRAPDGINMWQVFPCAHRGRHWNGHWCASDRLFPSWHSPSPSTD